MLLWPQKEHLTWCPRKSRPRWFRNPQQHWGGGIQPWSLDPAGPSQVHRAQLTSQRALSISDLAATAESRGERACRWRREILPSLRQQHQARMKGSSGRTPTLRPRSQACRVSAPDSYGTPGRWPDSPGPALPGITCRDRPPPRQTHPWEGTEGAHGGTSVTLSLDSFLLCEAREGWTTSAQTHCDTPGFWHQAALPVDKRRTFPWTAGRAPTLIIIFHQPTNFNVSY